ncbi:MAG: tRNA (N6-threonylcarbamoyladenosine(37)-N6)-methyltransferase TrmO [Desulfobacterales bacterium]|nr:tRNA (N6-threonylcarbamoyladenosine(37)-N6)-methyltransferase TrmO [Desulfobacterales bacterium]
MRHPKEDIRMTLSPVGFVRSRIKIPMPSAAEEDLDPEARKISIRAFRKEVKTTVSEIVIDSGLNGILDGIEGFSHILVLFWPHLLTPEKRMVRQVHPMGRKDIPKQGVFATRSPARPNPVLISVVSLIEREGNVLRVKGLDAVDGSPVIDIKPYVGSYHDAENPTVPGWMQRLQEDL